MALSDYEEPSAAVVACRAGGALVEILERRWLEPTAEPPQHRAAARPRVAVHGYERYLDIRRRDQAQPHRRDHSERPLRPAEEAREVVRRHVLAHVPACLDELARGEDRLQPGHPRPRGAVLERVRTARVRGHVAADLRLLGGAWIQRQP